MSSPWHPGVALRRARPARGCSPRPAACCCGGASSGPPVRSCAPAAPARPAATRLPAGPRAGPRTGGCPSRSRRAPRGPARGRTCPRAFPAPLTHTLTILLAMVPEWLRSFSRRRLPGIGYEFEWRRGFAAAVGLNFLIFTLIAIPLGELSGFIHWDPSLARLRAVPLLAVGIFFFTARPEEFLFRGLLQNLLARSLRNQRVGLIVAAVIFGFSHILHAPFPNWRYVILASIAGIFYGRAWMKTGSLVPAAILHGCVDILWHLLFR